MKNKLTVIIRHRQAGPTVVAKRTEPNVGIPWGWQNSLYNYTDRVYPAETTSHPVSTHPFSPSIHPSIHVLALLYNLHLTLSLCVIYSPISSFLFQSFCLYFTAFTYLRTLAYVYMYYVCVRACMYVCIHMCRRTSCSFWYCFRLIHLSFSFFLS
jgi:hypothetical protein